ncbi:MAG: Sec-independent protein translocase protein TatB [Lysobacterales bacterium]
MFDIGFSEILMVVVVSLIVIGPKRLPETVRFLGYWLGRIRRGVHKARTDMEREFGLDDIRRDLYNQELLGRLEQERLEVEQKLLNPQPGPPPMNPDQGELPFESVTDIEWVTPPPPDFDGNAGTALGGPSSTGPSVAANQNRPSVATSTQVYPTSAKQH